MEGFRVSISPDPQSDDHDGSLVVVDNGPADDWNQFGDIRLDACVTDHDDFEEDGYTIALSFADDTEADDLNCSVETPIRNDVEVTSSNDQAVIFSVECDEPGTATPTSTPGTVTPTVTGTPTGDTVTLAAVPANPACGSPSFLFATVRNQQGAPLASQTVTFSASGGLGSFNPGSGLTVADGVFSTTFTPPNTGVHQITISATANGKTGTAVVNVSCAAAQATATNTPAPTTPPVIVPPSTGDAGLSGGTDAALYAAAALATTLAFVGVLVAVRRDA